jgi:predicted Zn-dependent protease
MSDRLESLKQLVAEYPNDAFARYGLALEYANTGQTETALQEFAKLLEQHPEYTAGYQMAAQTLLREGRNDQARQLLQEGIACARRARNAHAESEMQQMLQDL